jgi:hypothetical protein
VAVAIGLAAGVQALDIALAISLIFSAIVLVLARSPFRNTGNTHHSGHGHHHKHGEAFSPDRGSTPMQAGGGGLAAH